jgi:hypothetical protein
MVSRGAGDFKYYISDFDHWTAPALFRGPGGIFVASMSERDDVMGLYVSRPSITTLSLISFLGPPLETMDGTVLLSPLPYCIARCERLGFHSRASIGIVRAPELLLLGAAGLLTITSSRYLHEV